MQPISVREPTQPQSRARHQEQPAHTVRGPHVSQGSFPCSGNVRAKAGRKGRRAVVAGGQAMTYHEYLSKAVQDDAQQAGERDRLLRVARRARITRPGRVGPAAPAPVRRLARLLFRRMPA